MVLTDAILIIKGRVHLIRLRTGGGAPKSRLKMRPYIWHSFTFFRAVLGLFTT